RLNEAMVALHDVGVVAKQVRRLIHVAEGRQAVLADLDGHQRRVLELALADEPGRTPHQLDPAAPAQVAPGGKGGPGRRDGVLDVLGRPDREAGDDDVRVDWRAILELIVGEAALVADEHRVAIAELAPGRGHRPVERGLELFVVGRERRVGDLHARSAGGDHRSWSLLRTSRARGRRAPPGSVRDWPFIIAPHWRRAGREPGSGGRRAWPSTPACYTGLRAPRNTESATNRGDRHRFRGLVQAKQGRQGRARW